MSHGINCSVCFKVVDVPYDLIVLEKYSPVQPKTRLVGFCYDCRPNIEEDLTWDDDRVVKYCDLRSCSKQSTIGFLMDFADKPSVYVHCCDSVVHMELLMKYFSRECFKCGTKDTSQVCGKCKCVRYCNEICQRTDWGKHKNHNLIQGLQIWCNPQFVSLCGVI